MRLGLAFFFAGIVATVLSSCESSAEKMFSAEEKKAPLVLKELYRDAAKSSHIILMNGAEKPHYHDRHRVEVVLVKGHNRLHLGDQVIDMKPEKPVRIEKGVLHWVENTGPGYSIVAADFYPPFDGKDRRFHAEKP